MAERKFGKKNIIKVDPLAYNLGLIGLSGIGKTTLAKEVCEELVGEDGYIIANVGREDGIDAIAGAIYEDIPDWDVFEEFTTDIIENKLTDYKDLKVIVWDTIDELIRIAEPEAIRLSNKDQYGKKDPKIAKTINQAWGGFGKGEAYTIDLIMGILWELKRVGVAMFLVGHTKERTMTDSISGLEYNIITTNMQHNYFTALKTKLHILGVASIDREIVMEKTGKKDFAGKDKIKGHVKNESRKITFRDDNFNVDSKSRFSEIIDSIEFNHSDFIKAVEDAIKIEHDKQSGNKSIEETKVEQAIEKDKIVEKNVSEKKDELKDLEVEKIVAVITDFVKTNRSSPEKLKPLLLRSKEMGYINPTKVDNLENANELLSLIVNK